ncbi:hypothetical protein PFISCL1PPCAC_24805, partial [Pristionchus fissidentatus]
RTDPMSVKGSNSNESGSIKSSDERNPINPRPDTMSGKEENTATSGEGEERTAKDDNFESKSGWIYNE